MKVKKGNQSHLWKGQNVNYETLHAWARKELGEPKCCLSCEKKHTYFLLKSGFYRSNLHLANVSQLYVRDLLDWMYLCPKCHKRYDNGLLDKEVLMKKLSTYQINNRLR